MSKKVQAKPKKKYFDISTLFFLITIVAIPNVYYKMALDKSLEPRLFVFVLFLGLLAINLIINKRFKKFSIDTSFIKSLPVLLYAGYLLMIIISIFIATNKPEAIHDFLKTTTFFAFFLYMVVFIIPKEKSRESAVMSFIIFGLIISIGGFIELAEASKELGGFSTKAAYQTVGRFAHKNIYSQTLFFTFTFSTFGIFLFKDFRQKIAYLASMSSLTLILLLMTRGVWVALFVSTFTILVVYFVFLRKEKLFAEHKKTLFSIVFPVVFGLVVLLAVTGFDSKDLLKRHIKEAANTEEGNTSHRIDIWKKSVHLIKQSPIIGIGAGNWKIDILQYDVTIDNGKGLIVPRRTHNDYITVITETGILGFIGYFSFFVLALFYILKILRKSKDKEDKIFIMALMFALVGYMTYSFFSFPRERIAPQIFLNIVFAFIYYNHHKITNPESKTSKNKFLKPIALFFGVIIFFTGVSSFQRAKSEVRFNQLFAMQKANRNEDIKRLAQEGNMYFSALTPFTSSLSAVEAKAVYKINGATDEVISLYEDALEDNPYHIQTLIEFANVYATLEDYKNTFKYMDLALTYGPTNPKVKLTYSYFLYKSDDFEKAYQMFYDLEPNLPNKQYKSIAFAYLQKITVALGESTNNLYLKQKLFTHANSQDELIKIYVQAKKNKETFEKTILSKSFEELKSNNTFIIDNSVDSLAKVYNVEL